MSTGRPRKPLIVTVSLIIYTVLMAVLNREVLTVQKHYLTYFGTIGVELVIIALVYYFLSKREKLRRPNK